MAVVLRSKVVRVGQTLRHARDFCAGCMLLNEAMHRLLLSCACVAPTLRVTCRWDDLCVRQCVLCLPEGPVRVS